MQNAQRTMGKGAAKRRAGAGGAAASARPNLRALRREADETVNLESFPNPAGPHGCSARAAPPDFALARGRAPVLPLIARRLADTCPPPPLRPRAAARPERETDLHPLQNIVPAKSGKFLGRDQFARLRLERALPLFRPWALPEPRRRISGEAFLLRPDLPRRTTGVHESASP